MAIHASILSSQKKNSRTLSYILFASLVILGLAAYWNWFALQLQLRWRVLYCSASLSPEKSLVQSGSGLSWAGGPGWLGKFVALGMTYSKYRMVIYPFTISSGQSGISVSAFPFSSNTAIFIHPRRSLE